MPQICGHSLGPTLGTLSLTQTRDQWQRPLLTVPELILFVLRLVPADRQQLLRGVLALAAGQCHHFRV